MGKPHVQPLRGAVDPGFSGGGGGGGGGGANGGGACGKALAIVYKCAILLFLFERLDTVQANYTTVLYLEAVKEMHRTCILCTFRRKLETLNSHEGISWHFAPFHSCQIFLLVHVFGELISGLSS